MAIVVAAGLTAVLALQGWNDWKGTVADTYANDASKTIAFLSMAARVAIGVVLVAAAAFAGRTESQT